MARRSKRCRAEARRDLRESPLQTRIDALVYAYRILGHTIARVNPLAEKRPENPLLTLREFGFSDKDLDYPVSSKFFLDGRQMTLREMIALLDQIYAGSIGAEFQHIQNTRIRDWVRHRLESRIFAPPPSPEIQVALLRSLLEAETFEVFLHSSYVGQKRFSLQGAEGLMAILDTFLHKCASDGVEEICMGMAHRGRLNVLANFLRKSLNVIFTEFTENYIPDSRCRRRRREISPRLSHRAQTRCRAKSRFASRQTPVISKRWIRWWKGRRVPASASAAIPNIGAKFCHY